MYSVDVHMYTWHNASYVLRMLVILPYIIVLTVALALSKCDSIFNGRAETITHFFDIEYSLNLMIEYS